MIVLKKQETESKILNGETIMDVDDLLSDESYSVLIRWGKIPGENGFEEYYIAGIKKGDTWLSPREVEAEDEKWKEKEIAIYSLFLSLPPENFS